MNYTSTSSRPRPRPSTPDGSPPLLRRKLVHLDVPNLVLGTHIWLVGLSELPSLIGDPCSVIDDRGALGLEVRRFCSGESISVQRCNIALRSPDGDGVCEALLSYILGTEVSRRVIQFAECQRCWENCDTEGGCWVPHPAKHQTFLGRNPGIGEQWNYAFGACHRVYAREGPGPMFNVKKEGDADTVQFGDGT